MRYKLIFITALCALLFSVPQAHARTTQVASPSINFTSTLLIGTQYLLESSMEDHCAVLPSFEAVANECIASEASLMFSGLTITELRPTGSSQLVKNHPNRFRARVTSPGASLGNWSVSVNGSSSVTSPTGGGTVIYFYVTPNSNYASVTVSVTCPDNSVVTRTEAFGASSGGSQNGGW
ncbi:MAG: hypothetical protein AB8H12_10140 [Lewinella sp.]